MDYIGGYFFKEEFCGICVYSCFSILIVVFEWKKYCEVIFENVSLCNSCFLLIKFLVYKCSKCVMVLLVIGLIMIL